MEIAKITVRLNGENIPATVTDKGTVILPSGEEKPLTEKQFQMIQEELKKDSEATEAETVKEDASHEETTEKAEDKEPETAVAEAEKEDSVQEETAPAQEAENASDTSEEKAEPDAATPVEETPAEEPKEDAEKIPVTDLGKKKEKPAKKKKPASFFIAIVFVVLFIAETVALGAGMVMGYVQVEGVNIATVQQQQPAQDAQGVVIPQSLLESGDSHK